MAKRDSERETEICPMHTQEQCAPSWLSQKTYPQFPDCHNYVSAVHKLCHTGFLSYRLPPPSDPRAFFITAPKCQLLKTTKHNSFSCWSASLQIQPLHKEIFSYTHTHNQYRQQRPPKHAALNSSIFSRSNSNLEKWFQLTQHKF